jgi:hypothetical protein
MNKNISLICYDYNLPLSNWDKFLNKKYPTHLGYILCSDCTKKRERKLIRELADNLSDLSFYDYPKTKIKYKKRTRKNSKNLNLLVRSSLNLGRLIS